MNGKARITPEIDQALYDRLKALAAKEHRSVNKQVEHFIALCMDKYLAEEEAKHA